MSDQSGNEQPMADQSLVLDELDEKFAAFQAFRKNDITESEKILSSLGAHDDVDHDIVLELSSTAIQFLLSALGSAELTDYPRCRHNLVRVRDGRDGMDRSARRCRRPPPNQTGHRAAADSTMGNHRPLWRTPTGPLSRNRLHRRDPHHDPLDTSTGGPSNLLAHRLEQDPPEWLPGDPRCWVQPARLPGGGVRAPGGLPRLQSGCTE